jgi:hypothetical protein
VRSSHGSASRGVSWHQPTAMSPSRRRASPAADRARRSRETPPCFPRAVCCDRLCRSVNTCTSSRQRRHFRRTDPRAQATDREWADRKLHAAFALIMCGSRRYQNRAGAFSAPSKHVVRKLIFRARSRSESRGRDDAFVDAEEAVFEGFGDPPDAADVAAVEIGGQAEFGVVRHLDGLGVGLEAVELGSGPEGLLLSDDHVGQHPQARRSCCRARPACRR